MRLLDRVKAWSLQDRLIGLSLTMVCITLIVAASLGVSMPGVVPLVLEGFAILMLAVSLSAAKWDFRKDALKSVLGSATSMAVVVLFIFAALSCVLSQNRAVSIQGAAQVAIGVLLYFVVSLNVQHARQISSIAFILIGLTLVGALIGCGEYGVSADGLTTGLFGDHQLYGSFLMILLSFAATFSLGEKNLNIRLAAQTATVATIIALILAHSHSTWLGAAFGLISVGVLVCCAPASRAEQLTGNRRFLAPAVVIAAGVMLLALEAPIFQSLLQDTYTFANAAKHDAPMDRHQVWHGAMRMIAEHPIIGIGESMFAYSHHAYTGVGSAPGLLRARPTLFDQTHNLYLQTAAEIGVPGAAALITILVSFWITGLRRLKSIERSDRRYLLMGSLGATVAFAVDAFTSPSWQFGQLMILFWLSLGLGVASMRQSSSRSVRRTQHLITVPSSFRRPAEALGLLGLAALMPPTVVASTRLNSYYPSTVYGAVNGTIQRVEIRVFNPSNQDQTVKSGPQYRLQLEVYLHEKSTIRDGGSVTLDPGTHWSAQAPIGTNTGTFTPEPSRHPVHEGGTINGNSGDYIAYSNTSGDAGRAVTIVATYMGFKATALLDFSNTVKPSTPPAGAGTAESRSTSNSTSIIPSK